MNTEETIAEFLIAGRQSGWRPSTVTAYGYHLQRFQCWLSQRGIQSLVEVTPRLVQEWGVSLYDKWQVSTARGALAAARSFFRWSCKEKGLQPELAEALKMPKVAPQEQRTLAGWEIDRLLRVCAEEAHGVNAEQDLTLAARNTALIAVLFDSMVRSAELCALRLDDVDLVRGRLVVRSGKGGKPRKAPLGPEAIVALRMWLHVRRASPNVKALFVSVGGVKPGRPLTSSGLKVILRKLGERAGLKGVSPHAFRRGGAAAATLAGAPSRLVQLWGGWSNLPMVELYTRALENDAQTDEQFPRFSPLGSASKSCRRRLEALQKALEDPQERPKQRRLKRGRLPAKGRVRWIGRSRPGGRPA